ncbi:DinB family protein [Flagellimonas algicola]|uniref:DinB family protein n=1 Tax=Flagellimonas algicola TaxID=2583815 RepID=A0ABY2WRN9_9FLAO|nr:DinB family protein [Allomuricauda algicola]TMU57410.1 DinB family protein [Allomuricauda algicola]
MKKDEIIQQLNQNHLAFAKKLESLGNEDFTRIPGPKWTAGQQLDHILKSVVPTAKIFNTPPKVLEEKFGLAQNPSRSYNTLVDDYLKILESLRDFVLPERFVPTRITIENRKQTLSELLAAIASLNRGLQLFDEAVLDSHRIVHPAMGKLTLREMLYFTIYHVTHHDRQILENLEKYPE